MFLLQPRFAISVLLAAGTGAAAWLMPLQPDWTAPLPRSAEAGTGPLLTAVSSSGRYIVTFSHAYEDSGKPGPGLFVWDRTRGMERPFWKVTMPGGYNRNAVLVSNDEKQLAIVYTCEFKTGQVRGEILLYDLDADELAMSWNMDGYEERPHVLFSPDGKLLAAIGGVVTDLATNTELRRLPTQIDDFGYTYSLGEFAIYRNDKVARLYSWLIGQQVASHDLVGNLMAVRNISRDGQIVEASGYKKGTGPWTANAGMAVLSEVGSGTTTSSSDHFYQPVRVLSPDGLLVTQLDVVTRPRWLPAWWPMKDSSEVLCVKDWKAGKTLAKFLPASQPVFSPNGRLFAVMGEDRVIEGYAVPFATPWLLIGLAAVVAGSLSWSTGWAWSRWRNRSANR
jgi:hypothetical protein